MGGKQAPGDGLVVGLLKCRHRAAVADSVELQPEGALSLSKGANATFSNRIGISGKQASGDGLVVGLLKSRHRAAGADSVELQPEGALRMS